MLVLTISSCKKYDKAVIEELVVDREFAPVGLTVRVRNQTVVELNWTVNENIDHCQVVLIIIRIRKI